MNKSIILMTAKQLWHRPVRLLLLIGFICFPLVMDVMSQQIAHQHLSNNTEVGNASMFVLIIGAGMIGLDISDGILPLIFSRPLKRWHYIVSKWLTVAALSACVAFIGLLIHILVSSGGATDFPKNFQFIDFAQILILSFGTTSVLLLFSSLLPGAADVGLFIFLLIAGFVMIILQHALHIPGMEDVATNLYAIIFPSFNLVDIKSPKALLSIEIGRYFALVFGCLCGSIFLLNEKEFSYGSN